jgi:mannose-6-phosphate isomerase-like protein (cupin superfamily)
MQSNTAEAIVAPAYAFFGTVAIVQARSEQTAGTYSLVEIRALKGNQPPLHCHDRDDEGFYVLEGEVRLHVGAHTLCLGPGQSAVAPHGVPHTYVVESEHARWLVISNAGFDRFVQELGEPLTDAEPDLAQAFHAAPPPMERVLEVFAAHGIELLGPPGTLPS